MSCEDSKSGSRDMVLVSDKKDRKGGGGGGGGGGRVMECDKSLDQDLPMVSSTTTDGRNQRKLAKFIPDSWRRPGVREIVQFVIVPWHFVMDDNYLSSRLTREERERLAEKNKSIRNKKGDTTTRRITNCWIPCVGGCNDPVHVDYPTYDADTSDFLVCSETCTNPIGAHKKCIRDRLAISGSGKFIHPCENCSQSVEMRAKFRFGLYELPHTLIAMSRLLLRHLVVLPFIFCYIWYIVLYIHAIQDWWDGVTEKFPGSPFHFRAIMYSMDNPDFVWEAHSLYDRWYQGFVFYTLCLAMWHFPIIGLRVISRVVAKRCRTLFYRYDK